MTEYIILFELPDAVIFGDDNGKPLWIPKDFLDHFDWQKILSPNIKLYIAPPVSLYGVNISASHPHDPSYPFHRTDVNSSKWIVGDDWEIRIGYSEEAKTWVTWGEPKKLEEVTG